jgi:hypothetical protein
MVKADSNGNLFEKEKTGHINTKNDKEPKSKNTQHRGIYK